MPVPAGPGDLYLLAKEYLDACADAVASGVGGPIPRAFVSPGLPAWDCCPQLSVHAGGPAIADTFPLQPPLQPGHRSDNGETLHLVNLTATVLRCVPTLGEDATLMPEPGDLDAAAAEMLGDVWAIWNHVRRLYREDLLFANPYGGGRRELFFDPAVSLMPQGGCCGWQIQIRVQLGGYGA